VGAFSPGREEVGTQPPNPQERLARRRPQEEAQLMDDFRELSEIGEVAQAAIGELQEAMPDDTAVKGVILVVEMEYQCDGCGDLHEYIYATSNTGSTAYDKGLLREAEDSFDARDLHSGDAERYHEDDD
jgi:hypothetical protein